MSAEKKVNILLVDDQPSKLLSYEAILGDLGESLIKATTGREALEALLKNEIAVVLMDVCMPELDGFQLAAMIREHPRFQKTAIIFISAIHLTDMDHLRGYSMGAVDYVPVPVIPEVLRAKVKVFAELYRKTRLLEHLNEELERRVAERTAELEASTMRLRESEQRRNLALAAGQMGSWDWDLVNGDWMWDEGQCRIFGVDPATFKPTVESVSALVDPQDMQRLQQMIADFAGGSQAYQTEFRISRADGEVRWCFGTATPTVDAHGHVVRVSGVTLDITERKESEERQALLAREVDHRARNALAVIQSIIRLTRSEKIDQYVASVEGRIGALSRAHTLLSEARWQSVDLVRLVEEELAPFQTDQAGRILIKGPRIALAPPIAQTFALALHELATNAAKYGALSSRSGQLSLMWEAIDDGLQVEWTESGGPPTKAPTARGFGTRVIKDCVEQQLGGRASFDWRPEGLHCSLSIPSSHRRANGNGRTESASRRRDPAGFSPLPGNRILLVEDEGLVALMMLEMLNDLGFAVIGPYANMADATAALVNEQIDAAILDVNLANELAYPLADTLNSRGIPFVFVTGYGAETIDPGYSAVPVLQKPIERRTLKDVLVRATGRAIRTSGRPAAVRTLASRPAAHG